MEKLGPRNDQTQIVEKLTCVGVGGGSGQRGVVQLRKLLAVQMKKEEPWMMMGGKKL